MTTLWQDLLKAPAAFIEASVKILDTSTVVLRDTLEDLAGRNGHLEYAQPMNGPRTAQTALADIGNAIVRAGNKTPLGLEEMMASAADVLRITRRSLAYRDLSDPRIFALPVELPLTAGALMADVMMKLVSVYSAGGAQRTMSLMVDAFDIFSDVQIFMSLQYKDQIERYEARLRREPGDYSTRLKLGQMYVKCGMFDAAVPVLESAMRNASTRAGAAHELLIAQYRAGRPNLAMDAGVQAMAANPANERTRNVLWLAAQAAGGYPESVPASSRMLVTCGYATPTVYFKDIAPQIGINKTNGGRGSAVFDYNNDGYLDIAVTGQWSAISLYRNNGDGTFTNVSAGSGPR